jgi:hypothetical protein
MAFIEAPVMVDLGGPAHTIFNEDRAQEDL